MDFDDSSYSSTTQKVAGALTKERSARQLRLSLLEGLLKRFSPSERLALYAFSIILGLSALWLLAGLNRIASVTVPVQGGTLTEGEVGPARFLNPLLTLSSADEDITELVFSGLMRSLPDGSYVPDLASSYEISEDGTMYTFHLRPDASFHDGEPLTSADVVFTVTQAQNPDIRSPREADWVGVQVSAPDARTVVFTLPHPYAPFIENTTMGILPEHLWKNVSADEFPFTPLNTHPVGSGPYRVKSSSTDSTGAATRYDLVPFKNFTLGQAYLKRISFVFYDNETELIDAFNAKKIDAIAAVSPADLPLLKRTDVEIATETLPRVFGVFFNQNHAPVLADAYVRQALNEAVDKEGIVSSVLGGYGIPLEGPVPPGLSGVVTTGKPKPFSGSTQAQNATSTPDAERIAQARATLEKGGWKFLPAQAGDETAGTWSKKKDVLTLTLSTVDEPELVATAERVVSDWKALGVNVKLQVYPLSEFNTTVLRPRSYDAILFGEVVGRSLDLFAFWHSSQRNDPGLNLAMYANTKADSYLSDARAETNPTNRRKLYAQFAEVVENDEPAVFLYAPQFIYLVPRGIEGVELGALTSASERFLNVYKWYTTTTHVWSIFTDK